MTLNRLYKYVIKHSCGSECKSCLQYDWRDWFVFVSGVHDSRTLNVHACEYYQHDSHGRTIAVASTLKSKAHISSTTTAAILRPLNLCK